MSAQLDVRISGQRPFHDLLMSLPKVVLKDDALDFANTPKDVLREVAKHAEAAMRTAHGGVAAIGTLLALCAADTEDGTFGAHALENISWLLAELGEMAALCDTLAACSRKELTEPFSLRPSRKRETS